MSSSTAVLTETATVMVPRFNALGLHFGPKQAVVIQVWLNPDETTTYAITSGLVPKGAEQLVADQAQAVADRLLATLRARERMKKTHTVRKAEQADAAQRASSARLPKITNL